MNVTKTVSFKNPKPGEALKGWHPPTQGEALRNTRRKNSIFQKAQTYPFLWTVVCGLKNFTFPTNRFL